jgi:hypothetical protein
MLFVGIGVMGFFRRRIILLRPTQSRS